jgi:hypothetical protein
LNVKLAFTGGCVNEHNLYGPVKDEFPASIEMPGAALLIEATAAAAKAESSEITLYANTIGTSAGSRDVPIVLERLSGETRLLSIPLR